MSGGRAVQAAQDCAESMGWQMRWAWDSRAPRPGSWAAALLMEPGCRRLAKPASRPNLRDRHVVGGREATDDGSLDEDLGPQIGVQRSSRLGGQVKLVRREGLSGGRTRACARARDAADVGKRGVLGAAGQHGGEGAREEVQLDARDDGGLAGGAVNEDHGTAILDGAEEVGDLAVA